MGSTTLDWALHYAARGWSVIPIAAGAKKARGKWGRFQGEPASEAQLCKWFGNGSGDNIAVILGAVSGGLVCRDFDTLDSYNRWAVAHPEWAAILPTVATARGRHVYCRARADDLVFLDLRTLDPPEDGEYRGDAGHYCLLPPSVHPDGPTYSWLVPPPDGDIPLVIDVGEAGLLPLHVTERDLPPPPTASVSSVSSVSPCLCYKGDSNDADIERAITESLPATVGRRNQQVFELARVLKGIPRLADAPTDALRPHVRRWHGLGLAKGLIGTESFDETWANFVHAWPRVRFPRGSEPLAAVLERAKQSAPPAAALAYEDDRLRLLVAFCRELQHACADHPFFLSCRTAAQLVGVDHVLAWRWLGLLEHDRVLLVTQRGAPGGRRATRYRWSAAANDRAETAQDAPGCDRKGAVDG